MPDTLAKDLLNEVILSLECKLKSKEEAAYKLISALVGDGPDFEEILKFLEKGSKRSTATAEKDEEDVTILKCLEKGSKRTTATAEEDEEDVTILKFLEKGSEAKDQQRSTATAEEDEEDMTKLSLGTTFDTVRAPLPPPVPAPPPQAQLPHVPRTYLRWTDEIQASLAVEVNNLGGINQVGTAELYDRLKVNFPDLTQERVKNKIRTVRRHGN